MGPEEVPGLLDGAGAAPADPSFGPLTPVSFVLHAEDADDFEAELDDATARMDDAFWARFVVGPFSWPRFLRWWVARKNVMPRDARKR